MQLFQERPIYRVKTASREVLLPEDPNQWPVEVQNELYKQAPLLSQYDVSIVFDKVEGEKGYGFGYVEVRNKSQLHASTDPRFQDAAGIKTGRVPLVVKERKLQPLDLLVDPSNQKVYLLNERRVRQVLFRPNLFDVASGAPGETSILGLTAPPNRQATGYGGMMGTKWGTVLELPAEVEDWHAHAVGITGPEDVTEFKKNWTALKHQMTPERKKHLLDKFNAAAGDNKKASLLANLLPTLPAHRFIAFTEKLAADPDMAYSYKQSSLCKTALRLLTSFEPVSAETIAAKTASEISPTVLQIRAHADGRYTVKAANHQCWAPAETERSRADLVRLFGSKIVLAADQAGSVTMAGVGDSGPEPSEETPKVLSSFGVYKVRSVGGKELVGYGWSELIDLHGNMQPVQFFTNGSESALQPEICGVDAGNGGALPEGSPGGHGVWVRRLPDGSVQATVPVDAQVPVRMKGDESVTCTSFLGESVRVMISPRVRRPTRIGDDLLLPEGTRWMPVDKTKAVRLCQDPSEWETRKEASAFAQLEYNGGTFWLDIPAAPKLAARGVGPEDVLFVLGGFGVSPAVGVEKLAASIHAPVRVALQRDITFAEDAIASASLKVASRYASVRVPEVDLWKEAAFMPDATTVDAVLSLGFLTPDNARTFVDAMPYLEEAQVRLGGMLLASRLGQSELPTEAIERSMRGMEDVLASLRDMDFEQQNVA
jgi:hypothetical protein